MRVTPKPGLMVRDPVTLKPLPSSGANVPETAYWVRRLRSGDVLLDTSLPAPVSEDSER